ncbi:MAG TPA: secondary thiamine-phosphate synthase enzyme YjbQ [Bacteroidales bacterium]|nr:secondary thiamine-phosphate synthase enzyme YjbQ [Bacteroidales bacterium]
MQKIITIQTTKKQGLYDITSEVADLVKVSKIISGLVSVYARGSTCSIMVQENWDESVQNDVICLLNKIVPHGVWEHDRQDNNGDSHLKSGLIGVSQTIPVIDGRPGLSTWQNIFFCEFDGPRERREIVVTIIADNQD